MKNSNHIVRTLRAHAETPQKQRVKSVKIQITTTVKLAEAIQRVVETGFYGTNQATAAERLICEGLRAVMKEGLVKRAADLEK